VAAAEVDTDGLAADALFTPLAPPRVEQPQTESAFVDEMQRVDIYRGLAAEDTAGLAGDNAPAAERLGHNTGTADVETAIEEQPPILGQRPSKAASDEATDSPRNRWRDPLPSSTWGLWAEDPLFWSSELDGEEEPLDAELTAAVHDAVFGAM
jgi:hypothetical protein